MADPAIGVKSSVVFDLEASWGTAKGSPAGFQIGVIESGIVANQPLIDNDTIRADFNRSDSVLDKKSASGPLKFVADVVSFPLWFKWMFGSFSTTGSADPWTHAGKIGTAGPLSAIIETSFNMGGTVRYSKATGCRVSRLTIPINPVGFLTMSMDIAAKDVIIGSSAYSGSPTDWRANAPFEMLHIASAAIMVDSVAVGYITGGEVTIDFGLGMDDYRVGADAARGSLVPGIHSVNTNLRVALESAAVLTLVTGAAYCELDCLWSQASGRTFSLNIPRLRHEVSGPVLTNGAVFVDVKGKASYNTGDTTMLNMTAETGFAAATYV